MLVLGGGSDMKTKSNIMEWIRNAYNVPAKLGGRIKYKGKHGTILGTQNQYLIIQLDGEIAKRPYHPTWEIEYLAT